MYSCKVCLCNYNSNIVFPKIQQQSILVLSNTGIRLKSNKWQNKLNFIKIETLDLYIIVTSNYNVLVVVIGC